MSLHTADDYADKARQALDEARLAESDSTMNYALGIAQTYATLAVAAATMAVAEGR